MDDLGAAVRAHCARFNAAQQANEWGAFVDTFAEDAHMAFTNVPVGFVRFDPDGLVADLQITVG